MVENIKIKNKDGTVIAKLTASEADKLSRSKIFVSKNQKLISITTKPINTETTGTIVVGIKKLVTV